MAEAGQMTIPKSRAALLDPAWLQQALRDIEPSDRIIRVEEVDSTKTIAEKVRFRVITADGFGNRREHRYCAKGSFDGSRSGVSAEVLFYRDLAPRLDVRVPEPYFAGADGDSSIVVMADVLAEGGRILGASEPYPIDTARESLRQLALFHASTWDLTAVRDLDWVRPFFPTLLTRYSAESLQSMIDDGRGPEVPRFLRDAELVAEAARRAMGRPVTCLLHCDTHSGNAYVNKKGELCWLDWQLIQPGSWSVDVSYHLSTVLTSNDRKEHEEGLLRGYLEALEDFGAEAPRWDEAWDLYRTAFGYGWFLWNITMISSREVVLLHLPRIAAALVDHQTFQRLGLA